MRLGLGLELGLDRIFNRARTELGPGGYGCGHLHVDRGPRVTVIINSGYGFQLGS